MIYPNSFHQVGMYMIIENHGKNDLIKKLIFTPQQQSMKRKRYQSDSKYQFN
jgi:hypothetical protein